jgi:hypothetical protein
VKKMLVGIAAIPFALSAAPVPAQNAPVGGLVTVYGNDPCPPDTICVRAPETERYRIPKDLRDTTIKRENESMAVRMDSIVRDNPTGTGSCSNVGAGGMTGCLVRDISAAKAERRAQKKAENNLPLP